MMDTRAERLIVAVDRVSIALGRIGEALEQMGEASRRSADALGNIATAFEVQRPPQKPIVENVTVAED